MGWWDDAGATVDSCDCDHYRDDCPTNREYGPRIVMERDRTGHHARQELMVSPEHPNGWPIYICECGSRDFVVNYYDHLADVAPMVEVYQ